MKMRLGHPLSFAADLSTKLMPRRFMGFFDELAGEANAGIPPKLPPTAVA